MIPFGINMLSKDAASQFSLGTIPATLCGETIHYSRRSVRRRRRRSCHHPLFLLSVQKHHQRRCDHQTTDTVTDRVVEGGNRVDRQKKATRLSLCLQPPSKTK